MNNEKYDYKELAEKFANKSISEEQLKALDKKVQTDKKLANEVAFQIALRKTFEQNEAREQVLTNELKGILAKNPTTSSKLSYLNSPPKILLIAASILGLLFLWFTVDIVLDKQKITRIASKELREMASEAIPRNKLSTSIDLENLLHNKDFDAAINLCLKEKNKFKDSCKNDIANYNLGKLQLYYQPRQDLAQAIQALTCIQENYTSTYPDISIHLARAYLWSGDKTTAQRITRNSPTNFPEDLKKLKD